MRSGVAVARMEPVRACHGFDAATGKRPGDPIASPDNVPGARSGDMLTGGDTGTHGNHARWIWSRPTSSRSPGPRHRSGVRAPFQIVTDFVGKGFSDGFNLI